MSRYHSYIASAARIINAYIPGAPFHLYLRQFFAAEKKYGSKDRKIISDLCYCYFRTSFLYEESVEITDRLLFAAFICGKESESVVASLRPEWVASMQLNPIDKIKEMGLDEHALCKNLDLISSLIDVDAFCYSILKQPSLFIRMRPGKSDMVIATLKGMNADFQLLGHSALEFSAGTRIDEMLKLNKDVVVQDLSSQKVFDTIRERLQEKGRLNVWDVCAASGGKSMLIYDLLDGKINITVSDIRKSMLGNLTHRFSEAGIRVNHKFVADVSRKIPLDEEVKFDLVICDVPCSGSGTWSRTPEQLYSFNDEILPELTNRQRLIAGNASRYLKDDGLLVYVTCSVLASENEENVRKIAMENNLSVIESYYIPGYENKADTMFVTFFNRVRL